MTRIAFLSLLIGLMACSSRTEYTPMAEINPVIGDASWIQAFGTAPDGTEPEYLRIRTHLVYAEQLLRNADVSHLSDEQKRNRLHLLDLLHDYHTRGQFPLNTRYKEGRRPCFIDDQGTICAVGYLIEQTLGRDVANQINETWQYATISEMDLSPFTAWMQKFGVSLTDLATIQPAYGMVLPPIRYYGGGGMNVRGAFYGYPSFTIGISEAAKKRLGSGVLIGRFTGRDHSLNYQSLGPGDFYGFFRSIARASWGNFASTDLGIATGGFTENGRFGWAFQPGAGFSAQLLSFKGFNLHAAIYYGYDFFVAGKDYFPLSRHDLSVRLTMGYRRTRSSILN